ncbi:MAG: hypothetical protein K6T63_15190 [Alicyclobacillus herbarius]|uniref:hypothetical protein n=1 Tax=Alicyclobacillus herbarius TaxID=122960 RepID=UPI0023545EB9|nr:hypothetical protein [Alicyclobacillus herbarius]MCL6633961.1 hypothetical protein [Alicyclobacillus herbarius]
MSGSTEITRYYVITSTLNSDYDGLTRYGRLQDVTRAALEISRYAPWMQFHIVEMPSCKIVKLIQDGQEFIAVQTTLFDEALELDEKYAAKIGKVWWRRWQHQAVQIATLEAKLVSDEMDEQRIEILRRDLDRYLHIVRLRLNSQSYELCTWKHLKSAVIKNRRVELPAQLRHYDKTSINRRLRAGYIDTGYAAYEQGWTLVAETGPQRDESISRI